MATRIFGAKQSEDHLGVFLVVPKIQCDQNGFDRVCVALFMWRVVYEKQTTMQIFESLKKPKMESHSFTSMTRVQLLI